MKRRRFLGSTIPPLIALSHYSRPARFRHARPVPSPSQLAWHRDELALFLHFGVNTYTDREWGDGTEDPAIFNPAGLDARQWARTAKAAGFKTLILTAKHHDGFCLWPSKLTTHSVASSPWREGQGDVVRELVDACAVEGLNAGLYLSPWDRHEPSYGDSPRYNDYYIGQLTELLTWYGPIREVWFDGANGEGPNGKRQVYDWDRIHRTVRQLQPQAVMFSDAGPDIRWIGNERGVAGDPNWCTMDPAAVPFAGADGPGIIEALQHGDPEGTVWRPAEADVSIRPSWFYHPAEDPQVRSTENLMDLYRSSVGRNAGLLLNVPPNREGLLAPGDVTRLREFGSRLGDLTAQDLASGAKIVRHGSDVELDLGAPTSIDHIVIQEEIEHGQSVAAHRVEVLVESQWRPIVESSTIGYKRIHRVGPVSTSRLRVSVTQAVGETRIARFGLFHSEKP